MTAGQTTETYPIEPNLVLIVEGSLAVTALVTVAATGSAIAGAIGAWNNIVSRGLGGAIGGAVQSFGSVFLLAIAISIPEIARGRTNWTAVTIFAASTSSVVAVWGAISGGFLGSILGGVGGALGRGHDGAIGSAIGTALGGLCTTFFAILFVQFYFG